MELVGKRVKHKIFGEGIITKQEASCIYVNFGVENTQKKFVYPSCFKSFLQLLDANVSVEVNAIVNKYEEQENKKKEQARVEAEVRRFERTIQEGISKSTKAMEIHPFASVVEFCEVYKKAITAEIMYLKTSGGKRQRIFDGKRIEVRDRNFIYSFEADDEQNYPEGTQITIWQGQNSFSGHVVGCEEFTIIISSGTDFGVDVPSLEFSAEPWRLLNSLIERLDGIEDNPSEIVQSLVCDGYRSIDYGNKTVTTGQENAVEMSKKQPITFVWGPPGTGKTQTLAKIALAHIEQGNGICRPVRNDVCVH